jgi:hypothetical protein
VEVAVGVGVIVGVFLGEDSVLQPPPSRRSRIRMTVTEITDLFMPSKL